MVDVHVKSFSKRRESGGSKIILKVLKGIMIGFKFDGEKILASREGAVV